MVSMGNVRRSRFALTALGAISASTPSALAAGAFYGIGDLPGEAISSTITDLSGDGRFVVGHSATENFHGDSIGTLVRWSVAGGLENLEQGTWGAPHSVVRGASITRDGTMIAGNRELVTGFRRGGDGLIRLLGNSLLVGDMTPTGGTIVGASRETNERAVRYRAENNYAVEYVSVVPNAPFQYAGGVSDDGNSMAIYVEIGPNSQAYLWRDGQTPVLIQSGSGTGAFPMEMSGDGNMIIGQSWRWTAAGGTVSLSGIISPQSIAPDNQTILGSAAGRAAYLTGSNVVVDVTSELAQTYGILPQGWTLTDIVAMSDDGTVWAGNGINPQGFREGWVAIIPEPTSAALSVLGLIALIRRRR